MSRKEKFYLSRGMRRAGPAVQVHKGTFCVIWVQHSTRRTWLMAVTDTLALTRDDYAYPKAVAQVMALCPSEMHVYKCSFDEAVVVAASIQEQLQGREGIVANGKTPWNVPQEYAIPRPIRLRAHVTRAQKAAHVEADRKAQLIQQAIAAQQTQQVGL